MNKQETFNNKSTERHFKVIQTEFIGRPRVERQSETTSPNARKKERKKENTPTASAALHQGSTKRKRKSKPQTWMFGDSVPATPRWHMADLCGIAITATTSSSRTGHWSPPPRPMRSRTAIAASKVIISGRDSASVATIASNARVLAASFQSVSRHNALLG